MKLEDIFNELMRNMEYVSEKFNLTTDAWEVRFRGVHLGTIDRKHANAYAVYNSDGYYVEDAPSQKSAVAAFLDNAIYIENDPKLWGMNRP